MRHIRLTDAIILAMLTGFPALAQDTPTSRPVDMTVVLTDARGEPMVDPTDRGIDSKDCSKCGPMTLGKAIGLALNGSYDDERNLGWQQRFDRAKLADRIRTDKAAVLDASEVAVIERLCGKAVYTGPLMIQIIQAIDPNAKAGKVQ